MGTYEDALDEGPEGLRWRVRDHGRRLKLIEDLKPEVMAYEVAELRKDFKAMKQAFYTFAFGIVGSSILFAFTVFALLGKGG